jgi:hypothetical protein
VRLRITAGVVFGPGLGALEVPAGAADGYKPGWQRTFQDEFDGTDVDPRSGSSAMSGVRLRING